MTLVRWAPAREMDNLFDSFFGGDRTRRWAPAIDLVETEDALVLRADLPGMSEEDIELEIADGVLKLSGERSAEHTEKVEGYYRFERASGRFARSIALPKGVDPTEVSASFDRGVLEVTIPKPEERRPHRISIGGGAAIEAQGTEKE